MIAKNSMTTAAIVRQLYVDVLSFVGAPSLSIVSMRGLSVNKSSRVSAMGQKIANRKVKL